MKLFHRKYGDPGPPMIIVHGLYGASDNWVSIAKEFANQYEVFVVDQRNHGESPHAPEHNYSVMRDDLLEFMDTQGLERAILMGHSMGGKTIMQLAMDHPDRVESLIVIDIAPVSYLEMNDGTTLAANHSKMIDAMMDLDLSRYENREEIFHALATSIGSERIRLFLLKNLGRGTDKLFFWTINLPALKENLDAIMDGLDTAGAIARGGIKGFPALFVAGEKSDYIRPRDHALIQSVFPTAEIVSIPGAGHWVHAEQPDLLVKSIRYFLEQ
jgi:pimeloyl-ACP methyl ester carboxylesterase